MKRTTIFLPDEQRKQLAKLAAKRGLNGSQLIRVLIAEAWRKEQGK